MTPERKRLSEEVPCPVEDAPTLAITIYCEPRLKNQLAHPEIAEAIFEATRYYVRDGTWRMRLMVIMPDHVHMLMSFDPCERVSIVIERWKASLARKYGIEWQHGFSEWRIRGEDTLQERMAYILNNPVRAGLAASSDEWKFVYPGDR